VRTTLLTLTLEFVRAARSESGVTRIALLGSIVTPKPRPKDIDLLVVAAPALDMRRLARLGRRLKGTAQSRVNAGADIFLASSDHGYLGRICRYRECHPRVLCRARHCGAVPHLADDLDLVSLATELIAAPPIELSPEVLARVDVPNDVEQLLLAPLRSDCTPI
jgi:predicted nucleotidyltransferase